MLAGSRVGYRSCLAGAGSDVVLFLPPFCFCSLSSMEMGVPQRLPRRRPSSCVWTSPDRRRLSCEVSAWTSLMSCSPSLGLPRRLALYQGVPLVHLKCLVLSCVLAHYDRLTSMQTQVVQTRFFWPSDDSGKASRGGASE